MFRNPFRYIGKYDIDTVLFILLLAFVNRELVTYRSAIGIYFENWLPALYILFGIAFLNLVSFGITALLKGDKFDEWMTGPQKLSAWRSAYLETVENRGTNNMQKLVWEEKLLSLWTISIMVSLALIIIGILIILLFSSSLYVFFIYLLYPFIEKFLLRLSLIKKK